MNHIKQFLQENETIVNIPFDKRLEMFEIINIYLNSGYYPSDNNIFIKIKTELDSILVEPPLLKMGKVKRDMTKDELIEKVKLLYKRGCKRNFIAKSLNIAITTVDNYIYNK